MAPLKVLLSVMFVVLAVYTTGVVFANDGVNLISPFVSAIGDGSWQGQFNLDFALLLTLVALWVAWRHRFTGPGIAVAAIVAVGGVLALSVYLLIESGRRDGIRGLLLGDQDGAPVAGR